MNKLYLYSTSGCHLCEIAMALLKDTLNPLYFTIEEVDISESETLMERYGVRIPVLADEKSGKELGWPFDRAQLVEYVEALE